MVPVFAALPTKLLGRHKAHSKRGWERPVSSSGPCQLRRAGGSGSRRAVHKPSFDVDDRAERVFFARGCFDHLRGAGVMSVAGDLRIFETPVCLTFCSSVRIIILFHCYCRYGE